MDKHVKTENTSIKSAIYNSFAILSTREKSRVYMVGIIQIFLGFLDLIGVALIGLIGSLAVNGIQSKKPTGTVSTILSNLRIGELDFRTPS